MTPPRQPPFLARKTYRRRRMMDAARMLPVLGALVVGLHGREPVIGVRCVLVAL